CKLLVGGIPYAVSLKTEMFSHKKRLSFRGHLPAPVRRLMNSAEWYLLFRNINPGLVGSMFSVDHNSNNNKVPEPEFGSGYQHSSRSGRIQQPDQRCKRDTRYEQITGCKMSAGTAACFDTI